MHEWLSLFLAGRTKSLVKLLGRCHGAREDVTAWRSMHVRCVHKPVSKCQAVSATCGRSACVGVLSLQRVHVLWCYGVGNVCLFGFRGYDRCSSVVDLAGPLASHSAAHSWLPVHMQCLVALEWTLVPCLDMVPANSAGCLKTVAMHMFLVPLIGTAGKHRQQPWHGSMVVRSGGLQLRLAWAVGEGL